MNPEVQSYNGVKTVEKSLRILELLLMAQEGLSIGQLVARTELHRASVHRLLTTLHALGWVERPTSRPIFRVSVRFYALAHVFVQSYGLLDRLQPLLTELSARTRETVHLGILDGWEVLHLGRVESPERVLDVRPSDAGMHLVCWFPEGVGDQTVAEIAAGRGLEAPPLSAHSMRPLTRGGLLLGYTAFTPAQIREAVSELARLLDAQTR